jgi:hypothetical protein
MRLHVPKKPWRRHGTPVAIKINTQHGPYNFVGSFHPGISEDPVLFPCYALFFDQAKALIIRSKDLIKPHGKDTSDSATNKPVPMEITTTEHVRGLPEPEREGFVWGWRSNVNAVRIGVAEFVISGGKPGEEELEDEDKTPRAWNPEVDGEFTLDKVMYRLSDESWGPILEKQPRICVTLL